MESSLNFAGPPAGATDAARNGAAVGCVEGVAPDHPWDPRADRVLLTEAQLVERARDAGAMAYLVKPFSRTDLVPAIEIAASRFTEVQQLEAEVSDLSERLETRKQVDRAKGILQASLGLSEPDSFRWIQKTAMDLRMSMRDVATGVVEHGPSIAGSA